MNMFAGASINKKNNIFLKILSSIVFLFIFVAILNLFQDPIKNFLHVVSAPVEKYFWKAGNGSSVFFTSLINVGNIAKENENLKIENQSLLIEIASLQAIEKENESLKAMAAGNESCGYKLVMAGITGLNAAEDIISINKGSADGILEGMPVISGQKVVFGKVLKVYRNFSEVMLISNKNNVLNVKVNDVYGVTRGNGNLGIYLDLVPTDSNINQGDFLATSSLEGTFPKDLLVGKVAEINKNDLKPFQTIKIEPFFNIKGAENLFVIIDYKQK